MNVEVFFDHLHLLRQFSSFLLSLLSSWFLCLTHIRRLRGRERNPQHSRITSDLHIPWLSPYPLSVPSPLPPPPPPSAAGPPAAPTALPPCPVAPAISSPRQGQCVPPLSSDSPPSPPGRLCSWIHHDVLQCISTSTVCNHSSYISTLV